MKKRKFRKKPKLIFRITGILKILGQFKHAFINFFNNNLFKKIMIIAFFLGLNIVLGTYFIKTNKFHLPTQFVEVLDYTGLVEKEELNRLGEESLDIAKFSLDPQIIFEKLNIERTSLDVNELSYNNSLATAAASLLSEAEKYDYDLENKDFLPELKDALKKAKYNYSHVSHNMVIGPLSEQAVVDAWFSDDKQIEALEDDDFTEVGFATKIVKLDGIGTVGIVVQVLGRPMKTAEVVPQQIASTSPNYPNISDEEVFEALNTYRASHGVHSLNIDNNLCTYASKRVQDLIAFGSLDNHGGFKKDFEDLDNIPEPIHNYPGSTIAENLAHQYCKNMATGDSFVAQTGTAIIEWCFDSSTKGHRETQLSTSFNNVCVRHGNNMYVVIFGN